MLQSSSLPLYSHSAVAFKSGLLCVPGVHSWALLQALGPIQSSPGWRAASPHRNAQIKSCFRNSLRVEVIALHYQSQDCGAASTTDGFWTPLSSSHVKRFVFVWDGLTHELESCLHHHHLVFEIRFLLLYPDLQQHGFTL